MTITTRRDTRARNTGSPPPAGGEAITVTGLSRRFGKHEALDGVSLSVRSGEIYGFLGPNGAGKSTLVRILCTLLAPTGGQAVVAGFDVRHQAARIRPRIGAALQATALDDTQTGEELLHIQAALYGLPRREVAARLAEIREFIDLGDALDRRVGTYSGGMKRRLDLALALVHRPRLVFLDEPTTGLDPASRAGLWTEISRLNRELGMTIFLTTQYMEEADELAHRVGFINRGRLVTEGTPGELKRSLGTDLILATVDGARGQALASVRSLPQVRSAEVQQDTIVASVADGPSALSPIAVTLAGQGLRVRDLTLRQPTLDDVFLAVTGEHVRPGEEPPAATGGR